MIRAARADALGAAGASSSGAIALPLLLAALPLPWLIAHHAQPWASALQEGSAAALLLAAALVARGPAGALSPLHAVLAGGILVTVAWQLAIGRLAFAGDAWMVALHTAVFITALATGSVVGATDGDTRDRLLTAFAAGLLAAAAVSVGLALLQWTLLPPAGWLVAELRPGDRPSANLGQPNHLGTAVFLGLCALGWLHRRGRLGVAAFVALGAWLALGLAMTQSRTAWLQSGLLAAWLVLLHRRAQGPAGRAGLAGWGAVFAVHLGLSVAWPAINAALLMAQPLDLAERLARGTRLLHLQAFADAVARTPWTGHGWLQTAAAALGELPARPPREYVESSHNLALDLAVWTGLPAAAVLLGAALGWIAWRVAGCRDPDRAWLLAMIGGVWVHAFTEYALYYVYFLVPAALAMGIIDASAHSPGDRLADTTGRLAGRARRPLAVAAAALLAVVGVDYLRAEAHLLQARLETARIGTAGLVTPAPDLRLLDQLETLGAGFAIDGATADPATARPVLDRLARRYGHAPLLFKQAQLAAREGRADASARWLAQLCAWHPPEACHGWIARWVGWAPHVPSARTVALPALPPLPPPPPSTLP